MNQQSCRREFSDQFAETVAEMFFVIFCLRTAVCRNGTAEGLVTLIIQFFCDLMNWFAVAFLG